MLYDDPLQIGALRQGVELLGTTGLSIGAIATLVGFQSPFHFSRMVSQTYQASPRLLHKRLWEGSTPDEREDDAARRWVCQVA